MTLAEDIKQKAIELGFDLAGITDASPLNIEHVEVFTRWLKAGFAGQMGYMHRNLEKRTNPAKLLKNAQSVICVGLNYTPPKTQLKPPDPAAPAGRVANYARYEDYHLFIKKRLRKLIDFIVSIAGADLTFKICVDSAPLAERAFAVRAGLGFIGKNRMLINPKLGPQILLGEIITNLKLKSDEPIDSNCSNCNKCITSCPTGALRPDGRFDANKCISYLTIEYEGKIPANLAEKIGARLFGCDECVLACPYQKNAPTCSNADFTFYPDRTCLNLNEILKMTEYQFKTRFFNSPLARTGLQKLRTTAELCLRNLS